MLIFYLYHKNILSVEIYRDKYKYNVHKNISLNILSMLHRCYNKIKK